MSEDSQQSEQRPNQESENTENLTSHTASELHLASLTAELKECKDKYLRLLAESENTRKRLLKERQDHTKYTIGDVVAEFLQPLDSFEKALKFAQNMSDEVKNWALGFEMILAQFKQILQNHGVFEFDSLGKPFDPHFHDGVEILETNDHEPGTVIYEFVKGYKMGDRIIRPARVRVSKEPADTQESNPETKD